MVQITAVRELPPRAGSKIRVSLLLRYGTWPLREKAKEGTGQLLWAIGSWEDCSSNTRHQRVPFSLGELGDDGAKVG